MKFLHLSDLHLGKRVHGFSMLEDQAYILQQILDCIAAEQPDGVLICGDIYDKAVPSAEAVALCDDFFAIWRSERCRCLPSAATTTPRSGWPLAVGLWMAAGYTFRRFMTVGCSPLC